MLEVFNDLLENYPIDDLDTPQDLAKDMFACRIYPDLSSQVLIFRPKIGDIIELEAMSTPSLIMNLPTTHFNSTGNFNRASSQTSVTFCVFRNELLFLRRISYLAYTNRINFQLGSYPVSARISGRTSVKGLDNPVNITFKKFPVSFNMHFIWQDDY